MKSTSMGCGGCKPSHLKIASSHDCQGGQIGDEEVDQVVADDIFILIQHSAIILIKITLIIKLLNKKYWNGKISSRSPYSTDKKFLQPCDNLTRSPLYCNPEDRPAKVRSRPLLFPPSCNWQIFRTSIFISILKNDNPDFVALIVTVVAFQVAGRAIREQRPQIPNSTAITTSLDF